MSEPFRLELRGSCAVTFDLMKANAEANRKTVPLLQQATIHGRKLAVCGGGPLIVNDLDELRAWDGDVWGVNHTAAWLVKQGVNATFVTVDPILVDVEPVENALIATVCDPRLFKRFAGKNVRGFDLHETDATAMVGGSSTVTRSPSISLRMGYADVSFFGCEGSYEGSTHVDRNAFEPYIFIIRAGGKDYKVEIALLQQCKELTAIFNEYSAIYKNRSGGLLRAMIENPDTWEIAGVSAALKKVIEAENGSCGQYEKAYEPIAA